MDMGLEGLVKKFEEYCGVSATKWLIRGICFAAFIGVVDFILDKGFDTSIPQMVSAIPEATRLRLKNDAVTTLISGVFIVVLLLPCVFIGDLFIGYLMRKERLKIERLKKEIENLRNQGQDGYEG